MYVRLARIEEQEFGDQYRAYMQRVPAFLPRFGALPSRVAQDRALGAIITLAFVGELLDGIPHGRHRDNLRRDIGDVVEGQAFDIPAGAALVLPKIEQPAAWLQLPIARYRGNAWSVGSATRKERSCGSRPTTPPRSWIFYRAQVLSPGLNVARNIPEQPEGDRS